MIPLKIVQEREPEESLIYPLVEFYRFNDYRRYRSVDTTAGKRYLKGMLQEILTGDDTRSWFAYAGDSLVGLAVVTHLVWDSNYFGLPMASLTVIVIDDEPCRNFEIADKLLSKALPDALCQKHQHLTVRVDTEETGLIHALEKHGFRLMDTLATYAYHRGKSKLPEMPPNYDVCKYSPEDYDAVLDIAKTSYKDYPNRFTLDPNIPRDRAQSFYTEWAKNCCNGKMAEEILVAKRKGRTVGFLAYRSNQALLRHTGIRLMGIGLAGFYPIRVNAYYDLILEGIRLNPGLSGDFETHLWNTTFINFFSQLDFHYVRAKHSFHRWLGS